MSSPPRINVTPGTIDLPGVIGGTFTTTIELFADPAQTVPFDGTGYQFTFDAGKLGALVDELLVPGGGLTIDYLHGVIVVIVPDAVTSLIGPDERVPYRLKVVDPRDTPPSVSFPVKGVITFEAP